MTQSYHSYLHKILEYYGNEDYEKALKYLNDHRDEVNGIDSQIDNFAFCIASLSGDQDLAMDIFEKAIREKGFWYQTSQLVDDPDLDPLKNNMKFKGLIEMNRRREHESLGLGQAVLHVREGHHDKGYIILHGNHENARITKGAWPEDAVDGALTIFFQSGQPDFHDAYHWNDRDKAIEDSMDLLEEVMEAYSNVKSWTLVGFSMSATVVIDLITKKNIRPDHLILFGPWLPYIKEERDDLSVLNQLKKISILVGDKDQTCMKEAQRLVKYLADYGMQADFITMENTGHGFPEDLKSYLNRL